MNEFRTLDLSAAVDDDEVWCFDSGAYVIGEPAPDEGLAVYIGTVADVRQQQADLKAAQAE